MTIWQAQSKDAIFDRQKQLGLHHAAFEIGDGESLDALYEKLKKADGVEIEFAPEGRQSGDSRHIMLFEPGGNRLEIIGK